MPAYIRTRSEFAVNSYTALNQTAPTVSTFADGGFVIAWGTSDSAQDGTESAIKAQLFDSSGRKVGAEFLVNTTGAGYQFTPEVMTLAGGAFVVAWTSLAPDGTYSIRAQIFDRDGGLIGGEFQVNPNGLSSHFTPNIAALSDGGFVISWDNGSGSDVRAQIYSGSGSPVGAAFTLNTKTDYSQEYGDMTALAGGGFVATWRTSDSTADGSSYAVKAQIFSASGAKVGTEFLVNTQSASYQYSPTVAALSGGGFVVAWHTGDTTQDGSSGAIKAQIFSASGAKVGSEFLVNTQASDNQQSPVVTAVPGGGFLVAWSTLNSAQDGSGSAIKAQMFDSAGAKVGGEMLVNTLATGSQSMPDVATLADGRVIVTWASESGDGSGLSIRAQILGAELAAPLANSAPVIISNGGGTSVALTQDEGVPTVATVVASDDGEPTNLRYSITGGADAAKFTINALTGVLAFRSNPDHVEGGDNIYDVTVAASDGQLTDSQSFQITLRHVNYVTIVSDGGYDYAYVYADENQTFATTVTAVDDDGLPLTYTITGGEDAGAFTIDAQTGELRFTASPDYEMPGSSYGENVYYVQVTASDGTRSDSQDLAVYVNDVEEPDGFAIVSDGAGDFGEVAVPENGTAVTVVAAVGAAGPVTYEIVGGHDASLFAIDPATGELSFVDAPDFEQTSMVHYGSHYYYYGGFQVLVRASDGSSMDEQELRVVVENVDEAPAFYSFWGETEAHLPAAENSLGVTTVVAYDDDGPQYTITYAIAGGADAALFEIDPLSGELSFREAPDHEARGDSDGDNVYQVVVEAFSGALSATQSLWIYLHDEDGEQTVISSNGGESEALVTMAENGTAVTVVAASGESYMSYEIAGGADAGAFVIDPYTGELRFSAPADFEAFGDADHDNVYEVAVRAGDGLTSDEQLLRVQLQNVNEGVTITSGSLFGVVENGTAVTVVGASDADGDAIGFALAGGADAALFTIDPATGALSFKSAPSFEAPADSNRDNVYEVKVSASDGSLSSTRTLSVQVTDQNESIAFISGGGGDQAAVNVDENMGNVLGLVAVDPDGTTPQYAISGGADAALFEIDPATRMLRFKGLPDFEAPLDADGDNVYEVTVSATDGQSSDHQSVSVTVANVYEGVSFAAPSRTVTLDEGAVQIASAPARGEADAAIVYSLGGADTSLFGIDPLTGALSWLAAPDFETTRDLGADNVYDLIVTASDGTSSASQAVSIAVANVDERPIFGPGGATLRIDEGKTAVGTVSAADPEGGSVSFAIAGGADAALFAIDSATGALSFLAAPDFEAPADSGGDNVYEVRVSASDGQLTETRFLSIAVDDQDPPFALTGEFAVNTTYQRTQAHSDVTRLADGNFVVTWIDADFNTSAGRFLRAQIFAPDGVKIGGELTLQSGNGVGTQPAVAALADGGFVVASRPLGSIAVQMFDSAGSATSAKLTVSNAGSGVGEPQIAVLANGGFAVTWDDSRSTGPDASGSGVHLQVYDSAGAPVGGDVLVNTSTAGNQADPSISALAGGGYVVTWTDRPGQGAAWVAKAQIFDSAGVRVGGEFLVSGAPGYSGSVVETSVVSLSNGNFAVAWSESDQSGPAHRIQIYTPAGVKVGTQILAPSQAYGNSVGPALAALSDGGFALAWSPNNPPQYDGSGNAVFVQAYDSAGRPSGPPLQVNSQANGDQTDPSIAGLADGRFVVTWTDLNGGGADDDQVMARIFAPEGYVSNQRPVIQSDGGGASAALAIDEGQTAVTTVSANDSDGPNAVTYSIAGGANAALFRIDSSTGTLSFAAAPDYEAPAAGSNNVYAVTVKASDGELSSLQSVQVTVRNVNEAVTVTSGAAASAAENSTGVMTVTAQDLDGDALSFAISGGADAALFAVDPATGELRFLAAPDFEAPADSNGDNVYEVEVSASDGTLSASRTVSVTVGNVDEAPRIRSYSGAASAAVTMAEIGSAVATVAAVDPDGASVVTYAIAGGADAHLFEVDSASGALRFKQGPDFEAPADSGADNVYQVAVAAHSGDLSAVQAFSITVEDVNETVVIASNGGGGSAGVAVAENGTAVTVVAAATGFGTVAYSIVGGADAAAFTIDPATGALAFASAPDFEAAGDSNRDNVYEVTVRAGNGVNSDEQAILVTVGDINEGVTITTGPNLSVREDSAFVTAIAAADGDGDPLSYAIVGGADSSHFVIDPQTGELSLRASLDYESPADADGDNVYEITVRASDGALSDERQFAITVTDVDDDVEIVSYEGADSVALTIDEGSSFEVADVDASMSPMLGTRFAIAGGADAALFTVDPSTGKLSFKYPFMPDFESPGDSGGDNVYDVVVSATLATSTDSQAFAITIADRNEGLWITSNDGGDATVAMDEGVFQVTTVTAFDKDGDVPTYSIVGGADAGLFAIDPATGVLTFVASPDYETPHSASGTNVYLVEVGASDGEFMGTQRLRIEIRNVNEGVAITSGGGGAGAAVTVDENGLAVTSVAATDSDRDPVTYAIAGGADSSLFTIDAQTGALSFVQAPDFEAPADSGGDNVYDVVVSATDGTFTDSQAIAVTVANRNEPLAIASNGGGAAASVAVAENGTAVATVAAADPDGGTVTYAIAGGADSARFTIDSATGVLAFVSAPNFEAPSDVGANNVYDVIVSASDGSFTDTQAIAVTVGNVDEGVFISSNGGGTSASVAMSENGTAVTTVVAADLDGGAVSYAIAGGADSARFTIDSATGVLAFVSAPNFEAPADAGGNNVYDVIVSASDGSFTDTQAIAVTVGNVNEGPVIISSGGGAAGVVSLAENSLTVVIVAATDPDGTAASYSIVGGADAARFTIDAQTGALQFVVAPDWELPADSNQDNVYSVIVRASDGQLFDEQALSVTVSNIRDGNTVTGTLAGDSISATSTNIALRTSNEEDSVYGRDGHDTIHGMGGDDEIYGEGGNDLLVGGDGADKLSGGLGKDQFTYHNVSESTAASRDLITDFSRSQGDKISLSGIDANSLLSNNQAFTFIGTSAFSNTPGQLRYETSGGMTTIFGDVNGDGVADLQIQLSGTIPLIASDFLL
jgi:hypothetical protein